MKFGRFSTANSNFHIERFGYLCAESDFLKFRNDNLKIVPCDVNFNFDSGRQFWTLSSNGNLPKWNIRKVIFERWLHGASDRKRNLNLC